MYFGWVTKLSEVHVRLCGINKSIIIIVHMSVTIIIIVNQLLVPKLQEHTLEWLTKIRKNKLLKINE